ncbi:MAG: N-acetylglutaminylglutamine amidotransferase, partial [Thiobacillus sp.]
MCGIAGEFRFDSKPPDTAVMTRMLAKLARRGPDAEGQHADGPVRLGHRRLAIIDLSPRSRQPMLDAATGTALVFNGTIYNYPELRAELLACGHVFHSDGDTEVILRAYLEWGEACVERLHGMFAFAIWNRETLFLARDRLGIKPLYYSENLGRFRFASTPQALLAAGGVDTGLDAVALHHLFTLHAVVPAPRTIYNGIRKLAPGTTLTV